MWIPTQTPVFLRPGPTSCPTQAAHVRNLHFSEQVDLILLSLNLGLGSESKRLACKG